MITMIAARFVNESDAAITITRSMTETGRTVSIRAFPSRIPMSFRGAGMSFLPSCPHGTIDTDRVSAEVGASRAPPFVA